MKYKQYTVGKAVYTKQRRTPLVVKILVSALLGLALHPLVGLAVIVLWSSR